MNAPQKSSSQPVVAWHLACQCPARGQQTIPLTLGAWSVGSSVADDIRLLCPQVRARHLILGVRHGALDVFVLDEGGHRLPIATLTQAATWTVGSITLDLRPQPESNAPRPQAATPPTSVSSPVSRSDGKTKTLAGVARSHGPWLTTAVVSLGLVMAVVGSVSYPWLDAHANAPLAARERTSAGVATPSSVALPKNPAAHTLSLGRLAHLTEGAGLAQHIRWSNGPGQLSGPVASGKLMDQSACERFAALRQQIGADRFTDKTLCLPQLQRSLTEFLAGTGLTVRTEEGVLLVEGDATGAVAASRLAAARASLPAAATFQVKSPAFASKAAGSEAAQQSLRKHIMAVHSGNPAHVVTREGERVYAGGQLLPGVELVRVDTREILVKESGREWAMPL